MRQLVAALALAAIGIGTLATGHVLSGVGLLVVSGLFALAACGGLSRHRNASSRSRRR